MNSLLRRLTDGLFFVFNLALLAYAADQDLVDSGIVAWLLLLALQFLAIVIHESGHAIAAHLAGARLLTYCVGWFIYDFGLKSWSSRRGGNQEIGGYVTYSFDLLEIETRAKRIWIAAAGPLANVLSAAFMVLAVNLLQAPALAVERQAIVVAQGEASTSQPATLLPDSRTVDAIMQDFEERVIAQRRARLVTTLAWVFVVLSLAIAILNLIPFAGSDGHHIWRNLRRTVERGDN